jgi:preprotein translocase subunit SecA
MDNKIMIVDEQTGRIMDGRRYSDGLHQAIEAKENVKSKPLHKPLQQLRYRISRMYNKLGGMTELQRKRSYGKYTS